MEQMPESQESELFRRRYGNITRSCSISVWLYAILFIIVTGTVLEHLKFINFILCLILTVYELMKLMETQTLPHHVP